jgi:hypothetical protein
MLDGACIPLRVVNCNETVDLNKFSEDTGTTATLVSIEGINAHTYPSVFSPTGIV